MLELKKQAKVRSIRVPDSGDSLSEVERVGENEKGMWKGGMNKRQ